MIRIAIVVEGSTEREFIRSVLASNLVSSNVSATPVPIDGNVTIQRLTREMANLYWNFDAVSSLVDFYGFQEKKNYNVVNLEQDIEFEARNYIGVSAKETNIIPYVQLHEFEALLFSDVESFPSVIIEMSESQVNELRKIRSEFNTPEDIDDGVSTAPGKRIVDVFPQYRKALHGPLIAGSIGLEAIRDRCPRFKEWLTRLSGLGAAK